MIKHLSATVCLFIILGLVFSPAAAASGSLKTLYSSGTIIINNGIMFNIVAAKALTIDRFDLHLQSQSCKVQVYYRAGGISGFETNAAAWTLLGEATVTGVGSGKATPVNVGGLAIPAGQIYGLYIYSATGSLCVIYNNSSTVYSNTELTIFPGTGTDQFFSGLYTPRVFNGEIYYTYPDPVVDPVIDPGAGTSSQPFIQPPAPGRDMVPIPDGSVVGSFVANTPLYYAPDPLAATYPPVWMDAGKTLWVTGINEAGTFYKVLFSGTTYWVPAETIGPNYDSLWGGWPLPTTVVE